MDGRKDRRNRKGKKRKGQKELKKPFIKGKKVEVYGKWEGRKKESME